ncbi:Uncharacterized protein OBRU01_22777 [Operophtera brumata]|uniref:DUF4776 domain-containing protein n=1 Tax=Operophtera brumata TaxID=104452 RepID=A0A0L7KQT5_OPEBR|nr:Uncharacterized protein OBRU01_22777 [Operophtera brumata]
MAVTNAMFIFEVVVESVRSLVESRLLVIRSDFADIFSLELKDPKQMQIVIPDPPPLPPAPAGKKKKQKKPKPKKGKKGKKGKIVLPPPEPAIQSGQSVLFTSSAEFLIQNMKKFPLEVSLWSKEDNFTYIGSTLVPWDPMFLTYLELIYNAQEPQPVTLKEEYNIFEEGTAKLMAKLGIQVKLSYLGERVTTAFRTLSEDPTVKKFLYTGINSKTTSYMCTMKTTDEDFEENCNKIENNYVVDKPENKIVYADYKNAAAANLTFFSDGDYCCMGHADKPPESMYKAPETCPDVDFIVDYVRKIIVSCNDNMRMLTPRPTITPRVKATDMDRLCYCKETSWPDGKFAQQFRKEAQTEPCPVCINAGKVVPGSRGAKFDIANLRGPCGKPDCRIARDLRAYIENLVEEDDKEFDVNGIIGPCGSKTCTLAEKIQEFIRHEGVFKKGVTLEGLPTQCACVQKMEQALQKKTSCDSFCSKDCDETGSEASDCQGKGCPFKKPDQQVYSVYYFTVEHDFDKNTPGTSSPNKENSFKYCSCDCPSVKNSEVTTSSKSVCSTKGDKTNDSSGGSKYQLLVCPSQQENFLPSPADSNLVLKFSDIHNPCCVKTCDVVEKVKDFIVDGLESKKKKNKNKKDGEDCYCDCECSFKFTKNTTYCAVCGGYECMGDDMKDQPDYAKPHPCPVYHKLYDKKYIETPNPWPEDVTNKKPLQADQKKGSKSPASKSGSSKLTISRTRSMKSVADRKSEKKDVEKKTEVKKEKKQVGKFTASVEKEPPPPVEKKPETKYPYPPVPKNMGWNWTAEDIPGMKPRPLWRPGAANKILVRRYRALREGVEGAKKKRGLMQRKKKPDNKPTLIVKKKDGEYIVQMEVFKKYSKDRLLFQNPYEDKPPLIYSIGKTAEEKANIQKQRDRRERRETRRKSRLLQSTFRDKCQEICLKAYNQAIGILPLPNPNDPECPCYTQSPQNVTPPIDSCSCSDVGTISSSDTDRDEWEIQFSPPAALYNAKAKHPPIPVENETQYTYLDYKVKLLDKRGNQVPRYFTGPEGKQECSDLGGFWSPNHEWQEINKDGYIGPDNRWVPMNFIGPDGMSYSAEEGSFTDSHGQLLKIGIDGYIDKAGKWAWYARRARGGTKSAKSGFVSSVKSGKDGKPEPASKGRGDAKGKDSPQPPLDKGKKPGGVGDKLLKSVSPSSPKAKKPLIMSVSVNYDRSMLPRLPNEDRLMVDPKKMAMYKEVMQYDDIYELKPPVKMNRASNTSRNKSSRNTNTEQQSQARHTGITGVVSATTDNQRSSKISKLVQGHAKTNGTAKMTTGYIPNSCDVQKFQGKSWTDSRPVTCRPEPVDCCSKLVECSPKPIECRPKPDSHRMSKLPTPSVLRLTARVGTDVGIAHHGTAVQVRILHRSSRSRILDDLVNEFGNVFTLDLKDPNEHANAVSVIKKNLNKKTLKLEEPNKMAIMVSTHKKLTNKKAIIRNVHNRVKMGLLDGKVQSRQSILLESNIDMLISNMKRFPIKLTLWAKDDSVNRLGSIQIPWSPVYIEYLHKITIKQDQAPAVVRGGYNVFDEYTSKRIATIRLNIKLTYIKDKITSSLQSLSEDNKNAEFDSKATTILSSVKDNPVNLIQETGIIKTIYSGGKRRFKTTNRTISEVTKRATKAETPINVTSEYKPPEELSAVEAIIDINVLGKKCNLNHSKNKLIKSDTDLDINKQIQNIKTKSCAHVSQEQRNVLKYIFGESKERLSNQVYCVGYFTVENDFAKSPVTSSVSLKESGSEKNYYKTKSPVTSSAPSKTSCSEKNYDKTKSPVTSSVPSKASGSDKNDDKTKSPVTSSVSSKAYGTEKDYDKKSGQDDGASVNVLDRLADSISVTKCKQVECANKEIDEEVPESPDKRIVLDLKSLNRECCDVVQTVEEVTGGMEAKMIFKKDDCYCSCECSFGFTKNTKYCGICGGYEKAGEDFSRKPPNMPFPCPIFHNLVDKNKLKSYSSGSFRPLWRPGATNKHVVRLLRMAKNPGEVFHKKKKKVTGSKKPLKRPLLVVQKKDGEYTVTMETMKTYQKPRTVNQNPYEDKPVHTYTIGRTEEENCERRKKKERKNRRLEREQRNFVESAFRDICNEICLKTYQQALGILPGAEDPDCPCYPAQPGADKTNLDLSCSCSEDKSYISSDTDCDEWVVEFTPPSATFDQAFKSKKVVKVDNTSQYTYLDYQVKLFDAYGKPIPRFFKGPDGRIQCSDLGGFWSPEHKWLEINNDGYIAPDGRWAPMNFIGPGGDKIDGQSGKFQGVNAEWLDVGIDGFVDCHGRWKFYPKPRRISPQNKKPRRDTSKKGAREKKNDKVPYQHSQVSWSCFGDVSPKQLSKIGIVGHGHDRKTLMAVLQKMLAQGEDVKIPRPSTVPRMPTPKKGKRRRAITPRAIEELLMERIKCRHRVPSDKGILAVDEYGNKTYFKKKRCKSKRQKQRMVNLAHQGISLSSFHVPCFNSSLNAEMMKQHQYQSEIVKKKYVSISTQAR